MHRPAAFLLTITAILMIACTPSSPPTTAKTATSSSTIATTTQPSLDNTAAGRPTVTQASSTAVKEAPQPVLVATANPTAEPTEEPIDWLTQATADGSFYLLGNPNAPVRLIDYSDFL